MRVSTQTPAGGRGKCALTKVRVRGAPNCHAASKHDVDYLGSMGTATHNERKSNVIAEQKTADFPTEASETRIWTHV